MAVEPNISDVANAAETLGYPLLLKNRSIGLNGRGNVIIHSLDDIDAAIESLSDCELYCESIVSYAKELSILIVQGANGDLSCYPVVDTAKDVGAGGGRFDIVPAQLPTFVLDEASTLAQRVVSHLPGKGVYCVEMYLMHDDTLIINEIIPRYEMMHVQLSSLFL